MKIGVTERGDAGLNLAWACKARTVDGMVLITKNITDAFIHQVVKLHHQGVPIIVHCTCTGFGGTTLEPNVPNYKVQLAALNKLIAAGFPASHTVLRLDPIFPSETGMQKVRNVLDEFLKLDTGCTRIRISIVDEYKHVKERYKARGWEPLYGDNFGPNKTQLALVTNTLKAYPQLKFEACAENLLSQMSEQIVATGCVSQLDLQIMGLSVSSDLYENPQNRYGCKCLSCKTELLDNRHPCPHGCVYCFWKS